jgi:phage anti-repressor protein
MELKDSVTSAAQFFEYQKVDPKKLVQRLYFTKEECDAFDILWRTNPDWVMMKRESLDRWFCKHHDIKTWWKFKDVVLENLHKGVNYKIITKKDPTWSKHSTPKTLLTNNSVMRKFYVFTSDCFLKICTACNVQLIDMYNKVERFREWKAQYDEACDAYTPPQIVGSEAKMDAPIPPAVEDEIKEHEYTVVPNQETNKLVEIIRDKMTNTPVSWSLDQLNRNLNMLVSSLLLDHQKEQFCVNLENIAHIMNARKDVLVRTLIDPTNKFEKKNHYIIVPRRVERGSNSQKVIYMLTSRDALRLCMQTACKNACEVRMFMVDMFNIFKACIMDESNKLINVVREDVKERAGKYTQHDSRLVNVIKERVDITDMEPQRHDLLINMLIASLKADIDDDPFPVSLDDLAVTLSYNHLPNLIKQLKDNFDEKNDYICTVGVSTKRNKDEISHRGGRNKKNILVTNDCAKELCSMRRNNVGKTMYKYFIVMEMLAKDYNRDPDNSVLSFLREEAKVITQEPVNPRLVHVESYKQEALAVRESEGKDVVYIYQIHTNDMSRKSVYTYGITYKFVDRGMQHRARYKCDCTLIKYWITDVPRSILSRFETSIGHFASNIGTRENYMKSRETFVMNEDDTTSLNAIIGFIDDTIPKQIDVNDIDMRKIELEYEDKKSAREYEDKKSTHEYEMMKLKIEMRKLDPEVAKK